MHDTVWSYKKTKLALCQYDARRVGDRFKKHDGCNQLDVRQPFSKLSFTFSTSCYSSRQSTASTNKTKYLRCLTALNRAHLLARHAVCFRTTTLTGVSLSCSPGVTMHTRFVIMRQLTARCIHDRCTMIVMKLYFRRQLSNNFVIASISVLSLRCALLNILLALITCVKSDA